MAFFVLDKDMSDGSLRLPIDSTFGTREEALAALSAAVASGEANVTGQVFVVDIDTALPVLVMPTPVAPPVAPEVAVVAEEAALEEPADVETAAEEPVAAEEAALEEPADVEIAAPPAFGEGSLADALKRAATSLEDEGIIAPESISADDFSFEDDLITEEDSDGQGEHEPEVAGESAVEEAASPELAVAGIAEPMSEQSDESSESPEVLEAPVDWPWANVEAFTGTEEPEVEEPEAVEVEVEEPELEEPAEDDATADFEGPDTLITSAPPLGEDAYVPRPVILGDYMTEPVAEPEAEAEPELAVESEPSTSPESEMGYEPTGDLDLDAYTCNDCVYANTCPKVGEVTPASCGTFQWRSS